MEQDKETAVALSPIPADARMGWWSIAFIQAGVCVCVPAFLLGALLSDAMDFWPAVLSGTLGYVIAVLGMCATGIIGTDLGLTTCTIATSSFGKKGSQYLVSVLFAFNLIGWFGIQNKVCGDTLANYFRESLGITLPVEVFSIICGIVMLITAIYGMSALEKLNLVSIPLLMGIMLYGTYLAMTQFGTTQLFTPVTPTMTFWQGVGLSFNFYAVGTITAPDFTRYQKTRKETILSTVWGVLPMGIITLVIGIVLTRIAGEFDISLVLIRVGIPFAGMLAMVLSTWTTNSTNAYSAGINCAMTAGLPDSKHKIVTAVVGIVAVILGAFGLFDRVESVLSLMSFVVCPLGGIILADYWVVGRGKPENWHPASGVRLIAVLTWAVSALLSYLVFTEYMGIVFAFVIYLILERFSPSPARTMQN